MASALFAVGLVGACVGRPHATMLPPVPPPVELDHVLMFAPLSSPEAEVVQALQEAGLIVDEERNEFPDGVIGRYVFFDNAYLELLWLENKASTDADTRRTAAWETTGASPFGVGLRRRKGAPEKLPFPSRAHTPEWMPPGTEMRLLTEESETLAPSLFVVPPGMAFTDWRAKPAAAAARTLDHALGVSQVTGVRVVTLPAGYPRRADLLADAGVLFERGDRPLAEIILDRGRNDKRKDLRPVLPLVLSY